MKLYSPLLGTCLLLAACHHPQPDTIIPSPASTTVSPPTVTSPASLGITAPTKSLIPWNQAVLLLQKGPVKSVIQTHSHHVGIMLTDHTEYYTTEPEIDLVFKYLKQNPNEPHIEKITE